MKAVSCGIPSGYTPLFPFCMSGQWYAVAGITGWNSSTGSVNVVVYNTFSSAQNCSAQAWLLCVRNKK